MPERLAPQWAISAFTSVPRGVARGRMHHEARRLVDDDDVVVLVDDIERDVLALRLGIGRLRHVDYDRIAGDDMISGVADGGGSDVALLTETWPARISAFSRERDSSARCAASTRSSRADPSPPSDRDLEAVLRLLKTSLA